MEPNKSDKHIKSLLDERTITPSEDAWSKLEARLDKDEKTTKKPLFWWSGIAAALIGVLLMVNLSSKKGTQEQDVVTIPNHTEIQTVLKNTTEATSETVVVVNDTTKTEQDKPTSIAITKPIKNNSIATTSKKKTIPHKQQNLYASQTHKTKLKAAISSRKVEAIVQDTMVLNRDYAGINTIDNDSEALSEADQLLLDAMALIEHKQIQPQKIDATSLLAEAEFEVEESFRTKVFKKIKGSITSLKNTLVNRDK